MNNEYLEQFEELQNRIAEYSKILPVGLGLNPQENERRAGEFLTAMALLTEWKHYYTSQKIKALSVQSVVYEEELRKGDAKTMTENKVKAEASKSFVDAREYLETVENNVSYLRTYYELFNNAHVFYRQLAKETL